jgi:acetyl esterase/lipase
MKIETIDLYAYFGIERPKNAAGYLTTYIINQSEEFCKDRLRPAMIVIPGGGYGFRSDRENEPIALEFLSKGFNAFALAYSVASEGDVKFPYQLIEGCMAVAFVRENADKYNVDKNHVCAVGFSAGGHLCTMLATIYDDPIVEQFLGKKASLCRLDGAILSYPVVSSGEFAHGGSFDNLCGDDEKLKKALSLETRVNERAVPTFIWCTADDAGVPSQNSLMLAWEYRKVGVPFELHVFESGVHGLSLANEEVNSVNVEVQEWLVLVDRWLKKRGFKISRREM